MNEYSSKFCTTRSLLKFRKKDLTETDRLEKTFLTFYASNMPIQQQYRERKFTNFSELITIMLITEKNNSLLMKNHQSRQHSFCLKRTLVLSAVQITKIKKKGRGKGEKLKSEIKGKHDQGPPRGGIHGSNYAPWPKRLQTSKIRVKPILLKPRTI